MRPELLAGLGSLRLRSHYLLDGTLAGMHASPFQGFSAEFDQYRGYAPGDDPRFFDWRIYGRTGHAVVKRFRDETNAALYLIVDTSASMAYAGETGLTKLGTATLFAGALATLGLRQRDALSLMTGAEGLTGHLPPRTGAAHYEEILRRLEALAPRGRTDLAALLAAASQRIKTRSITFIFTDLWQDPAGLAAGLRQVRAKNQSVTLAFLTTPSEEQLLESGDIRYRDLETGETVRLLPQAFRRDYAGAITAHRKALDSLCHDLGVRSVAVDISSPLDMGLRTLVRASLRGTASGMGSA